MFGQISVLRAVEQSSHKCASQSTVSSQSDAQKLEENFILEFSLENQSIKHKLCSKLSKATTRTLDTECEDIHSLSELQKQDCVTFDSKSQSCKRYFNGMCCVQGPECMFSHDSSSTEQEYSSQPTLSLFQLLEQYPELAILRGGKREYSLFFH